MADQETPEQGIGRRARTWLAITVVVTAIVGVSALAITVVVVDEANAQNVFNVLVPVVASWVGTVLAFYFGRENFESANREVRQLVRELSPAERANEPITSIMRPISDMTTYKIVGALASDPVTVEDLKKIYTGKVSRLPVLNPDGSPAFMIHESMFDKFTSGGGDGSITLAAFIADREGQSPPVRFDHEHGFQTVGRSARMSDAKSELDKSDTTQDVFITDSGAPNSAVIGWVSNVRLARYLSSGA